MGKEDRRRLDLLHAACVSRHPVETAYAKEDGTASRRVLRPLGLYFWSGVWTLVAWCELRDDFRVFRLDRMTETTVLERQFTQKRGQTLKDYLRTVVRSDSGNGGSAVRG